ncbi:MULTISPECIES: dephospho-CoA kinase [unclassified Caballeronia]|uniref:dephospho-CoA kinase n=1 Tax=unclassified Caballeronia TaxID=2646786 RepID=UPI0028606543|nr:MULTISPECIES: dephospho-CoA kinase [unclassified Caballeronia]MDR5751706.1 dephospho-CoA kinase [Caballeronia sp. LZ024]MDR5844154.1 dephospho-CoA kinase [Caballeronia sp. LZ031]
MFSIGLTGGIGSGKTTVADLFAAHGVTVIDTDLIAHGITAPGGVAMPLIESKFGREFVAQDGSLDRAKMRERVFADDAAKARLEAITHPLIRAETEHQRGLARGAYHIVAVPLLVESGNWSSRADRILVVDCPVETQIERVMRRNGFSREQVLAIIARQATREARLAVADDIVVNDANATLDTLKRDVDALHARYLSLADA